MGNNKPLLAHLCLFGSGAFWGLMAPVGKDAMTHGIEGIDMVSFRVLGGASSSGSLHSSPAGSTSLQPTSSSWLELDSSDWYSTSAATPSD